MDDLRNPLFAIPIFLVLAEMLTTVYLSRRRIKQQLLWIIGTYLVFIAVAIALGLIGHDEFGFSWIPLLVITNPWIIILEKLSGSHSTSAIFTQTRYGMLVGTLLNCAIFYILSKVSYPKHSARLSGQDATYRSLS